jgi:hypothetical protein
MKSLSLDFKHCYGIKSLKHTFYFEENKNIYSIYAPNGFMKTSFSKTFLDLSKNRNTGDLIFPERIPTRRIIDENSFEIKGENIFVIEPYVENFASEKVSLLLVNNELKEKHDTAIRKIEEKKEQLYRELKRLSGINGKTVSPEHEILKCFENDSIFDVFESLENQVNSMNNNQYSNIVYSNLFNKESLDISEKGNTSIMRLNNVVTKPL